MSGQNFIKRHYLDEYDTVLPYMRLFIVFVSIIFLYDRIVDAYINRRFYIIFFGLYVLFSAALIYFKNWRKQFTSRYSQILPVIDMAFISYVILLTGGSASQFYLFYILFIILYPVAYSLTYTIISGFVCAALYGGAVVVSNGAITGNVIFRLIFLIIATFFMGILNSRVHDHTYSAVMRDSLTALFNYKYFYNCMDSFIQRSVRSKIASSVALIDIDNFKTINDNFGHQTGDRLLVAISSIIRTHIRKDDIAARYGGDELAIIFPETKKEMAIKICERIKENIQSRFAADDCAQVTISIGIGTTPTEPDGTNSADLIHTVDKALYKAKSSGKNMIISA